jgi:alpha-tubulin suppressor-like RCC1 family protein
MQQSHTSAWHVVALAVIGSLLSACGGGESPPSSPPTTAVQQPAISQQPAGLTVLEGDSATFSVAATGDNLGYQWRRGAADIPGATSSTLTIPAVTRSLDASGYSVVISNSVGQVQSTTAVLAVTALQLPTITRQPAGVTVAIGEATRLTVEATGVPAPTFQWRRNGQDIAGASSASYDIAAVAGADAAAYDVVVANRAGSVSSQTVAVTIATPNVATAAALVAVGADHSCLVTNAGQLYCWGSNQFTQLGIDGADSAAPVPVSGLANIRIATTPGALVAGRWHTCALAQDGGRVYCWGAAGNGQLGHGSQPRNSAQPVEVTGLSGIVRLAASELGTCALTAASPQVWCWGLRTELSASSVARGVSSTVPVPEVEILDFDPSHPAHSITAGGNHVCVDNRLVYCWGRGSLSQLGRDDDPRLLPPRFVTPVDPTAADDFLGRSTLALAAGADFTCAIVVPDNFTGTSAAAATLTAGPVKCWGSSTYGELGLVGPFVQESTPRAAQLGANANGVPISRGNLEARALTAGKHHGCAVDTSMRVRCWGRNQYLQVGLEPAEAEDVRIPIRLGVRRVPPELESVNVVSIAASAASDHTCAITDLGTVKCWGRNDRGQLGRAAGAPGLAGDVQNLPAP